MSGRTTPRVDPAVRGFDRAAERYERSRPGYPAAAVQFLVGQLGIGPHRTVVELGSGTGKFTRELLPRRAAIVAVEPMDGMRRVFERELPRTLVLTGTAEAIPLPDRFADAVVVAQAFHWFRMRRALREIARVLRPDGGLGLIWNSRDESVPFSRRLSELQRKHGHKVRDAREREWRARFDRLGERFGALRKRTFRYEQRLSPALLVERVLSVSDIAVLPPERQRTVAREVRALLATDPSTAGRSVVTLPYRTDVYVAYRARRPG